MYRSTVTPQGLAGYGERVANGFVLRSVGEGVKAMVQFLFVFLVHQIPFVSVPAVNSLGS